MRPAPTRVETYCSNVLLKVNGWKAGQPYGEGTANFEVMREWNRAVVYRKTIGYFADQLAGH